ncbi:MAG: TRAM domain-containing protein [Bdellovibrionales bacterium]
MAFEMAKKYEGCRLEVLVVEIKEGRGFGRSRQNKSVHFPVTTDLTGQLVSVFIEEAFPQTLRGRLVQ